MDELKDQHNPHAPNGFSMQDTPPRADVDEILRRKRKAREYKVRYSDASCAVQSVGVECMEEREMWKRGGRDGC